MEDWKRRLDEYEEHLRAEKEAAEKEAHQKREKELQALPEDYISPEKLYYKCHIQGCKNVPHGFQTDWVPDMDEPPDYTGNSTLHEVVLWDKPLGVFQCNKCNQWTCGLHLHKKICKECAEEILSHKAKDGVSPPTEMGKQREIVEPPPPWWRRLFRKL